MPIVKKTFLLLFLLGLYTNYVVYAQKNSSIIEQFENGLSTDLQLKDSAIHHFNIYDRMKFRKVPALSVAVIKNGAIVLAKNYGDADISQGIKADSTTRFHFASISKTANALCILKLVEAGRISLTSDFRGYIKDGSFKETKYSKGQKITIANLLSHTAGINRDDGPSGDYNHNTPLPTITQIVKGEKPALGNGAYSIRKPNEAYEYSNQAIAITQKILADNFDADYNRLLTNMVLHPLKMTQSTFALKLDSMQEKQLARGYVYDYQVVPPWVFPCQAEGGLVSTTVDIAKMVIAIQNAYNEKDKTFLQKSSIETMFTPTLGATTSYTGSLNIPYKNGLGVMLFEKGGRQYFTHTGSIDGYTAVYIGSFDGIDGAVIVVNTSFAGIFTEILNSIATTFEWKNYTDYNYQTAIKPVNNDDFIGTYTIETPKSTCTYTITRDKDQYNIQNSNNGTPERLYFSSDTTAFVLSKGYTIEFMGKSGKIVVKNNGEFSGTASKNK
jgi:CubicO group peptidase (beta-lactamase class C family)